MLLLSHWYISPVDVLMSCQSELPVKTSSSSGTGPGQQLASVRHFLVGRPDARVHVVALLVLIDRIDLDVDVDGTGDRVRNHNGDARKFALISA